MSLRPCGDCGAVGTVRNHRGHGEWLCYACLTGRRQVPTTELDIAYFIKFTCNECGNTWPEYMNGGNPSSKQRNTTITKDTAGNGNTRYFMSEPSKTRVECPVCGHKWVTANQDTQSGDTDMRR